MRFSDWPQRLSIYLARASRTPFAYGSNDCALFAAGAIAAMTGEDLAAEFRGRYDDLAGGLQLVGLRRLRNLADERLEPIAPSLAHRGDVAWVVDRSDADGRRRGCFMIFDGVQLVGPGGVTRPRSAARRAWRVA